MKTAIDDLDNLGRVSKKATTISLAGVAIMVATLLASFFALRHLENSTKIKTQQLKALNEEIKLTEQELKRRKTDVLVLKSNLEAGRTKINLIDTSRITLPLKQPVSYDNTNAHDLNTHLDANSKLVRAPLVLKSNHSKNKIPHVNANGGDINTILEGWAYYGIRDGDGWNIRYFDNKSEGKTAVPIAGSMISSTAKINLRAGYITYDEINGWQNKPAVGAIKPGIEFRVIAVHPIQDNENFIWVKIEQVTKQNDLQAIQ
ncbi:hypothetical protein ACVWYF_002175 [Hymenobacter sp. UYAg731]